MKIKPNKSIAFLIPYFGQWPEWMPLFIDSIERNPTVDFHFFTDCQTEISSAPNINFHSYTFEEYVFKAKQTLGNFINISSPYKLCDLRPFLGLIHKDIIERYDFFGWTDTDILFGDIRSFYDNDILSKYEVISSHQIRLAGHCALLRTSPEHIKIGYKIYNWKTALQNPDFVGIDEHGITNALQMTLFDRIAEKFGFPMNNRLLNFFRKRKTRKHYFVEQYSTPFTPIPWIDGTTNEMHPSRWFYHKGLITNERDGDRRFMYLHLMNFKSSKWRVNGSLAPWDKLEYVYSVKNVENKIVVDLNGIRNFEG